MLLHAALGPFWVCRLGVWVLPGPLAGPWCSKLTACTAPCPLRSAMRRQAHLAGCLVLDGLPVGHFVPAVGAMLAASVCAGAGSVWGGPVSKWTSRQAAKGRHFSYILHVNNLKCDLLAQHGIDIITPVKVRWLKYRTSQPLQPPLPSAVQSM